MATKTPNQKRAAECVKNAKELLGHGWDHVSKDVQWGLVSANILGLLLGQDEDVGDDRVRLMMVEVNDEAEKLVYGEGGKV